MKTKNLILISAMVVFTATASFAQANAAPVNLLNSFSFTEYLLMTVSCVLLAVIWVLGKTVKSLSEQLR